MPFSPHVTCKFQFSPINLQNNTLSQSNEGRTLLRLHSQIDMNDNDLIQFFKLDPPSQNDSPTSNIPIWNRGKVIGEGTFGTIWLETHSLDARMRAIKQVKRHETSLREKVNQELLAVTRMSRPKYMEHFAHFFGWYEEGPNLSLAMEFFEFGDLRKHMRPETPFPETQCRDIMQQLLTGLDVLHNDGFAHRDLKPENIFVLRPTPQWRVKIGDFGIAKRSWNGDTLLRSRTGTLPYMAPEIFQWVEGGDDDEFKYTQAVDVWSIGIMLFEFLVGQRPFRNETALKMYCDRKVKFPAGLLRNYVATFHGCQFVQELLSLDPRSRPSAIQSLSRPWSQIRQYSANKDQVPMPSPRS